MTTPTQTADPEAVVRALAARARTAGQDLALATRATKDAALAAGLPAVIDWVAGLRQRPSYQTAAPAFDDRMWGPLKPVPETENL